MNSSSSSSSVSVISLISPISMDASVVEVLMTAPRRFFLASNGVSISPSPCPSAPTLSLEENCTCLRALSSSLLLRSPLILMEDLRLTTSVSKLFPCKLSATIFVYRSVCLTKYTRCLSISFCLISSVSHFCLKVTTLLIFIQNLETSRLILAANLRLSLTSAAAALTLRISFVLCHCSTARLIFLPLPT